MAEQSEMGRRRRGDQTRQLLLRAGVDIVRQRATQAGDESMAAALAHVRLTQVTERATELRRRETGDAGAPAITTGAVYNLWPAQVDFQADLLLHIAEIQSTFPIDVDEIATRYRAAAAAGIPLNEVLRLVVDRMNRMCREDSLYAVEFGFLPSAADPRVQRALRQRQDAFLSVAAQSWQSLLDAYLLQPRPPFTSRHLANALAAQFIGSVALWYANPEIDEDPAGEDGWSLTARAVAAIFDAMTMPADAAGHVGGASGG